MSSEAKHHKPPGSVRSTMFRPKLHYELLVCGLRGHRLLGTDVAELGTPDELVARDEGELRWHRCLRCDSWLPLQPPAKPKYERMPPRADIELPLRGRPLRDRIVLRIIAIDRALHFIVLGALGLAVFLLAEHHHELQDRFYKVLSAIEGGRGGSPAQIAHTGVVHDLDELFTLKSGALRLVGAALFTYAAIEGAEAIGLWFQKRWAEYLTFLATSLFLPLEIYELAHGLSPFKVFALIVNLAILVYLIWAKRLFGVRGGTAALEEIADFDTGWDALERTAPRWPD